MGEVIGYGGEDVSIVHVVYPRGTVIISSLGSLLYVGSSSKPSNTYFTISLLEHATLKSISRRRGRRNKNSLSHRRSSPGMRSG